MPESYEVEGSGGFALGWSIGYAEEKVGSYVAAYGKKTFRNGWDWRSMSVSAPISVEEVAADPKKAFTMATDDSPPIWRSVH